MVGTAVLCQLVADNGGFVMAQCGHCWVVLARGGHCWVVLSRGVHCCGFAVSWRSLLGSCGTWPLPESFWLVAGTAGSYKLLAGTAGFV